MSCRIMLCLAVLLCARVAVADGPEETKRRDTALEYAIGGSVASVGLAAVGVAALEKDQRIGWLGIAGAIAAPSAGEWYAGKYLTVGMGLRAAGAAVIGYGLLMAYCNDSTCTSDDGLRLMGAGLVVAAGGIAWDIATARGAADDYNAAHRPRATVAPMILQPPSGPVYGVSIGGVY
jgi:hypothetical protein